MVCHEFVIKSLYYGIKSLRACTFGWISTFQFSFSHVSRQGWSAGDGDLLSVAGQLPQRREKGTVLFVR